MGSPAEDPALYETTEVNGINVHVRHDVLSGDDGIQVRYSKVLFKESLFLKGIEI